MGSLSLSHKRSLCMNCFPEKAVISASEGGREMTTRAEWHFGINTNQRTSI